MDCDEEVPQVVFVHGHPRDVGWVVAYFRRPNRPDDGQLALIADDPEIAVETMPPLAIPTPRASREARSASLARFVPDERVLEGGAGAR